MDKNGSLLIMFIGYGYTLWGGISSSLPRVIAGLGLLALVGLDKSELGGRRTK